MWVAANKYSVKSYRFVVDGQTGHVKGERPQFKGKIAITLLIGLIITGGIGFLMAIQR